MTIETAGNVQHMIIVNNLHNKTDWYLLKPQTFHSQLVTFCTFYLRLLHFAFIT